MASASNGFFANIYKWTCWKASTESSMPALNWSLSIIVFCSFASMADVAGIYWAFNRSNSYSYSSCSSPILISLPLIYLFYLLASSFSSKARPSVTFPNSIFYFSDISFFIYWSNLAYFLVEPKIDCWGLWGSISMVIPCSGFYCYLKLENW